MARPGFNPTRRNRNIGTAASGHGQDNRLVIPQSVNDPRVWYASLGAHRRRSVAIGGFEMLFVVEETSGGCAHPCSVADVARMLSQLPAIDWRDLAAIVLRQPRRKERILAPAWGRLNYFASLGPRGRASFAEGPVLFLEALDTDKPIVWPASLSVDGQRELERIADDGHLVERDHGRWIVRSNLEAARATQLYRTLPHEIGHLVDWRLKVEEPVAAGGDRDELEAAYFARPVQEREAFAHRYADEAGERLRRFGAIPFEPISEA